jgi:hypothetical protein
MISPPLHLRENARDRLARVAVRLAVQDFADVVSGERAKVNAKLNCGVEQPDTCIDQGMSCPSWQHLSEVRL